MKLLPYLFALLFGYPTQGAFTQSSTLMKYEFEQVDSLFSEEERPLAVFIHTDWCRYCKNMEHTTFQKKEVVDLLNQDFYFISLNAEKEERTINFRGYPFKYRPNGRDLGVHSLAEALGTIDGELTYPAFVVLNKNYEIVFQYNEFIDWKNMSRILNKVVKN